MQQVLNVVRPEFRQVEQQRRRIGRRAGSIITEPTIEPRQVELVVEQVIQCMFEGAGKQLAGKIARKKLGTVMIRL